MSRFLMIPSFIAVLMLLAIAPNLAFASELICFETPIATNILYEIETCRATRDIYMELGMEYDRTLNFSEDLERECNEALEITEDRLKECTETVAKEKEIVEEVQAVCEASVPTFWQKLRERIGTLTGGIAIGILAGLLI